MGGEDSLVEKLKTDKKRGITVSDMAIREQFFGSNKKHNKKLLTLLQIFK
jgi:hypothetical protein